MEIERIREVFHKWHETELDYYIVQTTGDILRKRDGVYVVVVGLVDALGSKSKNGKEGARTCIAWKGKI